MTSVFLLLFMSTGWSGEEGKTCSSSTAQHETTQTQVLEADIRSLVDSIIKDNAIDMGITTLSMKAGSTATFQMEGAAMSNGNIAQLLEALKTESKTSKAYLVSTEKGTIEGQERQVFVMTAEYASL